VNQLLPNDIFRRTCVVTRRHVSLVSDYVWHILSLTFSRVVLGVVHIILAVNILTNAFENSV